MLLIPAFGWISEFEVSLVYIASSRTAMGKFPLSELREGEAGKPGRQNSQGKVVCPTSRGQWVGE